HRRSAAVQRHGRASFRRGPPAPDGGCAVGQRCLGSSAVSVMVDEMLSSIGPDLAEFERRREESVAADFGPMADAMDHIVRAGGKRLRPALVLLSAALGTPDRDHTFRLAMGIEFIHTATLV